MRPKDRLIVALDVDTESGALGLVKILKNDVKFFKIGFELFSSCGPRIVEAIKKEGCEIFLDLKFHDIPNTVSKAAVSITRFGVYMFNVHALGGYEMMNRTAETVREEAKRLGIERPKILAVTVLTSMDEAGLNKVGISGNVREEVLRLAMLAKGAGMDGVVASPSEAAFIREGAGKGFLIVTPGVRPKGADLNDQKRISTPQEAIRSGADFIVVGRPVTGAKDPVTAAREILKEV